MTDTGAASETRILEAASAGVLSVDNTGRITFANPAAAAMTGWSIEELIGAQLHALVLSRKPNGEAYPKAESPLAQTLLDGSVRSGEDTFWRKSGAPFPVQYNCSAIREGIGITGAVLILQDITTRKMRERQLDRAGRVGTLDRVAAAISHEFNNVLMGIQPFAEIIRRTAADDRVRQAAEQIISSVGRGKRATQEILRLMQPGEPALQPLNVEDWLRGIVPQIQALVGERISIAFLDPARPVNVRLDAVQMQQVILSLVVNVNDDAPNGGRITISVEPTNDITAFPFGTIGPDMAVITIHDTRLPAAAGPTVNDIERLFSTSHPIGEIALAVAQQVIVAHGGLLHVERTPGKGSAFYIVLPAETAQWAGETLAGSRAPATLNRVLMVEDEPIVASGIAALLEAEGIAVAILNRGEEAVRHAEEFRPDAVILDISLPGISGVEVFENLSARWPDLPVVFASGHGDSRSLKAYLSKPHVGFLRKPFEFEALLSLLGRITSVADAHP